MKCKYIDPSSEIWHVNYEILRTTASGHTIPYKHIAQATDTKCL